MNEYGMEFGMEEFWMEFGTEELGMEEFWIELLFLSLIILFLHADESSFFLSMYPPPPQVMDVKWKLWVRQ